MARRGVNNNTMGALKGTEKASGPRRSTILGSTDMHAFHCHLMIMVLWAVQPCPGFYPLKNLKLGDRADEPQFIYDGTMGQCLGTMSGKRFWL